jgi:hypothetical protein
MPNALKQCLGAERDSFGDVNVNRGQMVETSSQEWVAKHLYTSSGACLSICAKFMCEIVNLRFPTKQDYIEAAQWVQELPNRFARIDLLATHSGLRRIEQTSGQLLTDEIAFSQFIRRVTTLPSFNIFGFSNTQRTEGHALLLFTFDGDHWNLLDPNFGIAVWPHAGAMIVGLKRLLTLAYSDFGPFRRYDIWKYEK